MITGESTLAEAKAWLREQVIGKGARCPCCNQFAKVYRRSINSTQARALVIMYRECGLGWAHLPTLRMKLAPHHSNEEPKLRYWGLIEEELTSRPDGGRAGWWRVTEHGRDWILGLERIPKFALIYDDRCLRLEGKMISIEEALGSRFSFSALMEA